MARHHQEVEAQHTRSEKEELVRLRKIASTMAKEVKHFWDSIHKVTKTYTYTYTYTCTYIRRARNNSPSPDKILDKTLAMSCRINNAPIPDKF